MNCTHGWEGPDGEPIECLDCMRARMQCEIDRLRAAIDGVVHVSRPVEIDGEQWIAIPRAAWMSAAKAMTP